MQRSWVPFAATVAMLCLVVVTAMATPTIAQESLADEAAFTDRANASMQFADTGFNGLLCERPAMGLAKIVMPAWKTEALGPHLGLGGAANQRPAMCAIAPATGERACRDPKRHRRDVASL